MNRYIRHSMAMGAGLALALCGGAVVLAQTPISATQAPPAPTQASPGTAQTETPSATVSAGQQAAQPQPAPSQPTIQMVQAQAELSTSLDAKKATQGESVKAKLEQNVQIPGAQELPKNTVLEGHVDQVTASQNKGDSTMVVTFDKAKLKDGQELNIKATVIALSEPAMATEQGGGSPAAGGMPSGGGAPMAGGGGGGASGERGSSGASSTPSMPSNASQSMNTPGADSGGPGQQQGTGVPDVTLTSSIHEHTSATLTSKGRNVHVPDGTQMQIAIAVIPAGVKVQ